MQHTFIIPCTVSSIGGYSNEQAIGDPALVEFIVRQETDYKQEKSIRKNKQE